MVEEFKEQLTFDGPVEPAPAGGPKGRRHPRNDLNDLTGTEWIRFTKSWVRCDGKRSDITADIEMHPASFPPELAMDFILFFTKSGQTVLDPFVGCGSTVEACVRTGRRAVGVDLSPKWFEASSRRARSLVARYAVPDSLRPAILNGDAQQVDALGIQGVDYCITSPPYWDMLRLSRGGVESNHKKRAKTGLDTIYSDDARDLGNVKDYQDYLHGLERVFQKVHGLLRPGGYLTVVVQNIRLPDGTMAPVAWDLGRLLGRTYALRQERIWVQDQKMLGIWGYPRTYVSNVHHHYCLIFQKAG